MNTITGTPNFVSFQAAVWYYSDYGYSAKDVQEKLTAGEISIGEPELKEGEQLCLNAQEGRYSIKSINA